MLQRAASNAYSWWWASHIRTKQSKWLEQNLQDLEEKVAYTLKLIEEDGDSFAKRAEMYYKKRPELISFVEEAYRAYRALAERYDHISTELQNANTTIARVCPDQVPFMDDDDDDPAQKGQRKPVVQTANIPKVPNMPKKNLKGIITLANKKLRPTKSTQKADAAKVAKSGLSKAEGLKEIDKLQKQILGLQTGKEYVESSYQSWLAKYWEIEEQIKGLQQRVCCLQDEFGHGIIIEDDEARSLMVAAALKSCQDTLTHMQEQQEKSSEEAKVESKRIEDTRDKFESLKDELIGNQGNQKTPSVKDDSVKTNESKRSDKDVSGTRQHREDLQIIKEKVKEQSDVGSSGSLSVTEMAEQIDEVVSKVVNLETSFLSQTSLVQRLRTETDELQAQIRTLEDDKASLIHDKKGLSSKLREMEQKLLRLHDLNQSVEDENISLQAHLNDARYNLDHLSQKLQNQKTEEELESSSEKEEKSPARVKLQNNIEGRDVALNSNGDHKELQGEQLSEVHKEKHITEEDNKSLAKVQVQEGTDGAEAAKVNTLSADEKKSPAKVQFEKGIEGKEGAEVKTSAKEDKKSPVECVEGTEVAGSGEDENKSPAKVQFGAATKGAEGSANLASDKLLAQKPNEKVKSSANALDLLNVQTQRQEQAGAPERDCEPDWKHMFLKGMENREKTILTEYTTVLRNYKEAKKKLDESGMKSGDTNDDTVMQLQQLKTATTEKDEEIRSLRKKLSILQAAFGDDQSETHNGEPTVREVEVLVTPKEQSQPISEIEEKFRMNIDELLEENLDFWLRFSASFHQIQKFDTEAKDLQNDALNLVATLEEKQKKQEGSSSTRYALKSDVRPLYTHLGEIQSELALWVEKSSLLKEEMTSRCSSLSDIQEEITKALKLSAEDDDFRFTSYQAAKFQGEVLNMKQENNKVADELQAGLDHVNNLQTEVEKTLMMLSEKFGISDSNIQKLEHSDSKNTVPLRSFIFGVKPKRSRAAFLFSMHPTLARKYNDIKGAVK